MTKDGTGGLSQLSRRRQATPRDGVAVGQRSGRQLTDGNMASGDFTRPTVVPGPTYPLPVNFSPRHNEYLDTN